MANSLRTSIGVVEDLIITEAQIAHHERMLKWVFLHLFKGLLSMSGIVPIEAYAT